MLSSDQIPQESELSRLWAGLFLIICLTGGPESVLLPSHFSALLNWCSFLFCTLSWPWALARLPWAQLTRSCHFQELPRWDQENKANVGEPEVSETRWSQSSLLQHRGGIHLVKRSIVFWDCAGPEHLVTNYYDAHIGLYSKVVTYFFL